MWNGSSEHRGQFNWLNNNSSMLFFTQPCGLTKLNLFLLQDVLNITHLCKGFQCSVHLQQQKYQVFTFYSCLFWIVRWKHAWGRTPTAMLEQGTREILKSYSPPGSSSLAFQYFWNGIPWDDISVKIPKCSIAGRFRNARLTKLNRCHYRMTPQSFKQVHIHIEI